MSDLSVVALIVAAGRGARMGAPTPKQFLDLGGRMVLSRAIAAFAAHPLVDRLMVVIHGDDAGRLADALAQLPPEMAARVTSCTGGDSRQQSVHHGLEALAGTGVAGDALVLIHDAARPFVGESLITRAIAAGRAADGAIPVLPVVDTVAEVAADGALAGNPDRARLRTVQTPQVFRLDAIVTAHRAAAEAGRSDFTDDAGLIRWRGGKVATFAGCPKAFKLTTPEDVARADRLIGAARTDIRTATGYDVHAFGPGDHIMLGGVRIAHERGVVGHSDADVLLHALTDALLGCIADGDIGVHFPPSDMRWKGAASRVFLAEAVRRVTALGGEIRHLDGSIVAEAPKVGPHREAIRATIADIAGIDVGRVGLKATTSEKLGFTGRREGIAALATATIALPKGRLP
jgi:2-C-methyl-D-erythritol 4-phosphate cytidylyltransferase/2-C-methyl-D-erythritol 2,4-cyclodiphosphate synthase